MVERLARGVVFRLDYFLHEVAEEIAGVAAFYDTKLWESLWIKYEHL